MQVKKKQRDLDPDHADNSYYFFFQNSCKGDWHKEYMEGASMEIYRTPLPSVFLGWTFSDIAATIYNETGSMLIGFESFNTDNSECWRQSLHGMGAPAGSQLSLVPKNMVR